MNKSNCLLFAGAVLVSTATRGLLEMDESVSTMRDDMWAATYFASE